MPLVEQELFTLPEHLSSTPVFNGIRVTRSLVLYVYFVDHCLSICTFFFWPLCCLFFFDIQILLLWYLSIILDLQNFFHWYILQSWKLETTDTASSASFLDAYLEFDDSGQLSTKIYDKRDDFNFKIINFPNMCSNIPASPACVVYISQLIRYARASSNYSDFLKRHLHLRNRLLDQGYWKIRLLRSLKQFIFRYQDLVDIYSVSVETIISDAFS
jgi:hypothetical protein